MRWDRQTGGGWTTLEQSAHVPGRGLNGPNSEGTTELGGLRPLAVHGLRESPRGNLSALEVLELPELCAQREMPHQQSHRRQTLLRYGIVSWGTTDATGSSNSVRTAFTC